VTDSINGRVPVWSYQFSHPASFDCWGAPYEYCVGRVCHGQELPFVFNNFLDYSTTDSEQAMAKALLNSWSGFIRTGDPNNAPVNIGPWPATTQANPQTLFINWPSSVLTNNRGSQCAFWNDLGYSGW
jgi:carboxylesterase type B